MNDAYSPYKALRHLDVIQAVRTGIAARPVHVQMILSDLCNQACAFCAYRDPAYTSSQLFRVLEPGDKGLRKAGHEQWNFNPNRMIAYDKAIEILDDCREMGVEAIQFTGGGEPTVHPRFVDILRATRDRRLAYSVVTNGVAIGKSGLSMSDDVALGSWVRVSLDAARPETYARIRNVPESQFHHACRAVTLLHSSISRMPTDCVIGVGFVVTPDNWQEVYEAARLARSLGADNIRISAQFSAEDERLFAGFHAECAELCREAESLTRDGFTVFNRFGARLGDLEQHRPDYESCGYQQFTTYIGADLNVYRCCVLAYNERGIVGSIKERRFRDMWMSQDRADGMAAFKASDCARCQFNSLNRVIGYATAADDPQHAEFV